MASKSALRHLKQALMPNAPRFNLRSATPSRLWSSRRRDNMLNFCVLASFEEVFETFSSSPLPSKSATVLPRLVGSPEDCSISFLYDDEDDDGR